MAAATATCSDKWGIGVAGAKARWRAPICQRARRRYSHARLASALLWTVEDSRQWQLHRRFPWTAGAWARCSPAFRRIERRERQVGWANGPGTILALALAAITVVDRPTVHA